MGLKRAGGVILVVALVLLALPPTAAVSAPSDERVYAVTTTNRLVTHSVAAPELVTTVGLITGLDAGEFIVGMDSRPRTGDIYAVGSSSKIYIINPQTAAATFVADMSIPLQGSFFGVDFNPVTDRLHIVSDTRQSLRVAPTTGETFLDTPLSTADTPPAVAGAAFRSSFFGSSTESLFDVDAASDRLMVHNLSTSTLSPVGPLGIDINNLTGFDISPSRDVGFMAATPVGSTTSRFFRVDLTTGAATVVGPIELTERITAMTIAFDIVGDRIFGVTQSGKLISFASGTPGTVTTIGTISGLDPAETILGIDFRPLTGQLVALGSSARLYSINTATAEATLMTSFVGPIEGTAVGMDFDPLTDRLRVISDTGQNLSINPLNGVTQIDSPVHYVPGDPNASTLPIIAGAAYTNNAPGSSNRVLWAIDAGLDKVVRVNNPTRGEMSSSASAGLLGFNSTRLVGFDVTTRGIPLAALNVGTGSTLFTVNFGTGVASAIGVIGGGEPLVGMAAAPPHAGERMFGLTTADTLAVFDSGSPGQILANNQITGLVSPTEDLLAIDFRPRTSRLYAISNAQRLYTINTTTAAATFIANLRFDPPAAGSTTPNGLQGTVFGMDFDPVADRIQFISDTGQNLRINPITAEVESGDELVNPVRVNYGGGATVNVTGAAFTNNFFGASTTTLLDIDAREDDLVSQNLTTGFLTKLGDLREPPTDPPSTTFPAGNPINTSELVGFDISDSGAAFAILTVSGLSQLYAIDVSNTPSVGVATLIGQVTGLQLRGFAIAPVPPSGILPGPSPTPTPPSPSPTASPTPSPSPTVSPSPSPTGSPSPSPTVSPTPSPSPSPSPSPTVEPPGTERIASSVTITYSARRNQFKGRVRSGDDRCESGRKVVVKRVRSGPDERIGADRTNTRGAWAVRDANPNGRYYAKVGRKEFIRADGTTVICLGDRSPTLRV